MAPAAVGALLVCPAQKPSRGKYIFKTPAVSQIWYLPAVPQRPEKIEKGILKEFLTLLEHLNFTQASHAALTLQWEPWQGHPGPHLAVPARFPRLWLGKSNSWLSVCTQVSAPPVLSPPQHGTITGAVQGTRLFSGPSLSSGCWAMTASPHHQPQVKPAWEPLSGKCTWLSSQWEKKWKANDNLVKKIMPHL